MGKFKTHDSYVNMAHASAHFQSLMQDQLNSWNREYGLWSQLVMNGRPMCTSDLLNIITVMIWSLLRTFYVCTPLKWHWQALTFVSVCMYMLCEGIHATTKTYQWINGDLQKTRTTLVRDSSNGNYTHPLKFACMHASTQTHTHTQAHITAQNVCHTHKGSTCSV